VQQDVQGGLLAEVLQLQQQQHQQRQQRSRSHQQQCTAGKQQRLELLLLPVALLQLRSA
jgi:hypothetical protein